MNTTPSSTESAQLYWHEGALNVTLGGSQWSFPREALPVLIRLLEAGQSLDTIRVDFGVEMSGPSLVAPPLQSAAAPPTSKRRKSRKRVGDALVLWMEENSGWHHVDDLLEVVIENEMTDASPLRALKIALGKQRNVIFSDGGRGYWKLESDQSAGSVPTLKRSPYRRQRVLAAAPNPGPVAAKRSVVRVKQGESRRQASVPELSAADGEPKEPRWNGVSQDEVARARRNLLGLGSTT